MTPRLSNKQINIPALVRIVGFLLLVEAAFLVLPLIICILNDEPDSKAFLVAIASCVIAGSFFMSCRKPRQRDLGKREGLLLTALVWVFFSLFGMIPFILSDSTALDISEAFFESMSGFTTTGVSVIGDVESLPMGIHFWRCLVQWIGGMGIILFTVALLPMLNSSGGMQMMNAEMTGITHDKISPRVSQTAKRLWLMYTLLTLALWGALWIGPMDLFESLCHSLSTVSTGGFSTRGDSIGAWDSVYVKIVVILFMFIGGVNFGLMYKAVSGHVRSLWRNEVFRAYVKIVVFASLFLVIIVAGGGLFSGFEEIVIDPVFQVVSTITSTGYTVGDFSLWGNAVFPLLYMLMFMGACAGSTSGGAKIDRMIYLWKNGKNELNKTVHPNRFYPLTVNGKVCSPELLSKVFAFIVIYIGLIFAGAIILALTGIPLGDSFFAVVSCFGNTGLGTGATSASYDVVSNGGLLVLSFLMLVGRLEIFTVIVLFTKGFWKK